MNAVLAQEIETIFRKADVTLTLGGEPTFVPIRPIGAEWSHTAVGETKLPYAQKLAEFLIKIKMPGALTVLAPGKLYPGEPNSRWALRLLTNRNGTPLWSPPIASRKANKSDLERFRRRLGEELGLSSFWIRFHDPKQRQATVYALPLDYKNHTWRSDRWPVSDKTLIDAPGAAGLRLPLSGLPAKKLRRALTLEIAKGNLCIFLPPLPQKAFIKLLEIVQVISKQALRCNVSFSGYVPDDKNECWVQANLAADPGVLEVNLPPCPNWAAYADWLDACHRAAKQAGLRPWKAAYRDHPVGTGGGNHLLFGGPSLEKNPFFTRPQWVASLIRYFQAHPSLSYLFIGSYVGPSSQAPRPDEASRDVSELELALRQLESLPEGTDQRERIVDILRYHLVDRSGNTHRCEISLDKFWNPGLPGGCQGLIEFRALESSPRPEWNAALALLWLGIAARTLKHPFKQPLKNFHRALHDRFFLPSILWSDLLKVADDLEGHLGDMPLMQHLEAYWHWRFPRLLEAPEGLEIRKAHEHWPLLHDPLPAAPTTSRIIDASMRRLELKVSPAFLSEWHLLINGRPLPFPTQGIAGLRYRHTACLPSLHPLGEIHLPLEIQIRKSGTSKRHAWVLRKNRLSFQPHRPLNWPTRPPCQTALPGDLTFDLRLP